MGAIVSVVTLAQVAMQLMVLLADSPCWVPLPSARVFKATVLKV